MVATGTLPARDEGLARLECWIHARIGEIDNAEDRRVVEACACGGSCAANASVPAAPRRPPPSPPATNVTNAIRFLAWLRSHGRTLAPCRQADVDLWLARGPPTRCRARAYLRWATARRLVSSVDIVRHPDVVRARSVDAHDQAALAQHFLADAAIPSSTGPLVLLDGQALTARHSPRHLLGAPRRRRHSAVCARARRVPRPPAGGRPGGPSS